jgi:hypothetical protein
VRFGFRFCLAMRDPNALHRVTAKTFQRWMWYEQVEPFGELRDDYRAAQIVTMVHNTTQKQQKKIEDFLLKFGEQKKRAKQTPEEEARAIKLFITALTGVAIE